MNYHLQMMALDYVMLILAVYIALRGMTGKDSVHLNRFSHYSHSVCLLALISTVIRMKNIGAIHPARGIVFVLYIGFFLFMTLAAFEWLLFFETMKNKEFLKDRFKICLLLIPLFLMFILCCISYFTGWLFQVTDEGEFVKGPMFLWTYVFPYVYSIKFLIGLTKMYIKDKKGNKNEIAILAGTIAPVLVGSILQYSFSGSYVVSGVVVGCLVVYLEIIMSEMGKLDKLEALSEVNTELEKNLVRVKKDYNIIKSLALTYNAIYLISLKDYSFAEVSANLEGVHNVIGETGNAIEKLEVFWKHICYEEYSEDLREFTDLLTVEKRLEGKKYISRQYEGNLNGWGEAMFFPVDKDEEGHLLHVIFATSDINDQKIIEFEHSNMLEMALDKAKKANRSKTIFLNNMSHDIRTPMNAIVGFTNLAMKNIDNKELAYGYLSNISDASEHLLALINDILDLSRIESGKLQVMEKEIDLKKFISDIVTIIEPSINDKGLHLVADVSSIKNQYVVADRLRLEQILLNILSNSIKFTDRNGMITFKVTQLENSLPSRADYEFYISDTGIGMSEEFVAHIFEAFAREENDRVNSIQGTGLGMAITKNFIDLMNGSIEIKSTEGKGSEFYVRLSFATCNGVMEKEDVEDIDFKGKRLLLAEDNMLNREIAQAILEEIGFMVEIAIDGDEAVDMVKNAENGYYDAVLMDIRMPRMNGYDATRAIRALESDNSKIPIVAMTANAFEEDRKMAFDSGMNGHLAKPIDIKLLKATLARMIN